MNNGEQNNATAGTKAPVLGGPESVRVCVSQQHQAAVPQLT